MKSPELDAENSWWSQPCGPGEVLAIALPLVVSTAAWTVMHFTDRVFLLWHSQDEMAAAMPSGMLLFALMSFPLGLVSYVNTFIAQYHGAERPHRIGSALGQAIWLAVACIPLFLLLIPLAASLFEWAGHTEPLVGLEVRYFRVLTCGAGASIVGSALAAFFTGRGQTTVVMYVHVGGSLLNVLLDYLWVFGYLGFPEGGLEGAAWATVVSDWTKVAVFAALVFTPENRTEFGLDSGLGWDWSLVRRMFVFGGPNGLHMFVENGAFAMFLLLMGQLGPDAVAATTLAASVNSMAFVPMLGVGMAVSTLVGRELGGNRPAMAERATWNAALLATIYTGLFAAAYLLVPTLFLAAHEAHADPARFEQLRDTSILLLRFVALYCVADALNVVFSSAIRGAGDTTFVLCATFVIGATSLGIGWYGLNHLQFGLNECWWVMSGWIGTMGVTFTARFLQGAWREMRVIEPELVQLADETM